MAEKKPAQETFIEKLKNKFKEWNTPKKKLPSVEVIKKNIKKVNPYDRIAEKLGEVTSK